MNLGSLRMGGIDEELADSVGLYSVLDLKIDVSKLTEGHASLTEVSKQVAESVTTKSEQNMLDVPGSASTKDSEPPALDFAASSQSLLPNTMVELPSKPEVQDVSDDGTLMGIEVLVLICRSWQSHRR